ncbi:host attachment protein [Mameliella sp. AT18]|uniref:host attachment protein n=1 Tax=Mameliella sp. AT18 TaxID=3028385 RepID=UPI00237B930C|nr:host attachment protein [Mameliella sp. AT18]MDD9731290.1 host attachment protein [Mameliella sp. AT18]
MSRSRTWALIMDSVRARVLRGVEGADGEEPVELVSRAKSTHLRDIMADKAGRSFSSDGSGRRSAMELGADPIHRDMQEFAVDTAEFLERHRRAGDFARLAVFAEPKMLGILRTECPATLWAAVCLDRPLNLISLPERELRERVLEQIQSNA